jgi:phosphoribosyl-AMP cyclohydrolase
MQNIAQAVAERRGVITSHDVAVLWGGAQSGGHAVAVTGAKYDADGNLAQVIINDTGQGQGGRSVPAAQFESSLRPGRDANVTDSPVW